MIDHGFVDGADRHIRLAAVDRDNWRAVADIAPHDEQRGFVPALAAYYLLLTTYEEVWHSLAVYADDQVVGHLMWGFDDADGAHWIGGMVIGRDQQGRGVGRAALRTIAAWLAARDGCRAIRLSYHPENAVAARLYRSLGFVPTGAVEDDEIVAELAPRPVDRHG